MTASRFSRAVCIAALLGVVSSTQAQMTPAEAVSLMGRGINLGNTLEPPTEAAWNNPRAEEYYFDDYVSAGFKTVRVPVRWDQHTATTSPYAVNGAWMDRVEEVVDWGLSRDLFVVLNAHHEDWLKQDYSAHNTARFDSIWSQVATRFKDKTERLQFEIINEPQGLTREQTDELNARILGIIRKTNPTRIVVYSGAGWSSATDMMAAAIPDDDYLMAYYHSYDPWEFGGLATRGWGSEADRADLRQRTQQVAAWSANNGIPVALSEFGAIHDNDHNDRMKFYAAYVEEALDAGLVTQVWDDGGDFRVYDRQNREWPEVKDILIHTYPDGPTGLELSVRDDSVVVVSWTNRYGLGSGITVERKSLGGDFTPVGEVAGTATSFEDTTIAGGQTYDYRVIVRDARGPDRYGYPQRLLVPAWARSPFGGTPWIIPGSIEAEDYDVGGEGLTYHDTEAANIPEGYRPGEGVDIEARDGGGWQLAYVEAGEWLEYTVDVQTAGTYTITAHVASLEGFGRFRTVFQRVGADAPYPTNTFFRAPRTDSWQTTQPVSVSMDLEAGEHVMRLEIMTANPFNIDRFDITLDTATGLTEQPANQKLALYPNPVREVLRLHSQAGGRAEIVDVLGRRVAVRELAGGEATINTSGLPNGMYVLRLESADGKVDSVPFVRH